MPCLIVSYHALSVKIETFEKVSCASVQCTKFNFNFKTLFINCNPFGDTAYLFAHVSHIFFKFERIC